MKPTRSAALAAPVQSFSFHDTTLDVARDNGDLWVSIRRVCEALGVAPQGQVTKLNAKPWAVITFIVATGPDGKNYRNAMLHLDALPMWLATIEPGRVAEDARPRLERFQVECSKALRDHFFGKPGHTETPPADLQPHEVQLPPRPTAEQHDAKRDAMVKRAWDAVDAAGVAMQEAWMWEDRASFASMHASIAKILLELPDVVREHDTPFQLHRALETVLTQVLVELRLGRHHRGHEKLTADAEAEATKILGEEAELG